MFQNDLDRLVSLWNAHRLRPSRNQTAPSGRPALIYSMPHLYGSESHACQVNPLQVSICETECMYTGPYPCDKTVFEICCLLMAENSLGKPNDAEDAIQLYGVLRNVIHAKLVRL